MRCLTAAPSAANGPGQTRAVEEDSQHAITSLILLREIVETER